MTVRAIVPIIEYTGNGVITKFDWDWDMIDDSSINVLLNNENVTNWTEEGQSVVFDTAPADGDEIIIYRRTLIRQPENYRAFGRFHSEKTELSADRMILIAQERAGDRGEGNAGNGIVGGANLSITRGEFSLTVVSERGTDAVLPMYDPDGVPTPDPTPDPTIIWEGATILAGEYSLPGNTEGVSAVMRFRMGLTGGDPTEASVEYPNYNATAFIGWLDSDPVDNAYWMRVRFPGGNPPPYPYIISDGLYEQTANVPFRMTSTPDVPFDALIQRDGQLITDRAGDLIFPRNAEEFSDGLNGPYISVNTFGLTAPVVAFGTFLVDICKDNGVGEPDEAWVTRTVILEAIFNG